MAREVSHRFDIPGKDLATMLQRCFAPEGRVSQNTRKQFARVAPRDSLDFMEERVMAAPAARAMQQHAPIGAEMPSAGELDAPGDDDASEPERPRGR